MAYFVKHIRKLSNGLALALYGTFGNESFVKAPEVLFTLELTKIQLDSLVTLIVMTYGKLEHLFVITGAVAGVEKGVWPAAEDSLLQKDEEWMTLLLQYQLQQNRSSNKEGKNVFDAKEQKRFGGMPLLTALAHMMRIDPLAIVFWIEEVRDSCIRTDIGTVFCRCASEGV